MIRARAMVRARAKVRARVRLGARVKGESLQVGAPAQVGLEHAGTLELVGHERVPPPCPAALLCGEELACGVGVGREEVPLARVTRAALVGARLALRRRVRVRGLRRRVRVRGLRRRVRVRVRVSGQGEARTREGSKRFGSGSEFGEVRLRLRVGVRAAAHLVRAASHAQVLCLGPGEELA